MINITNLSKKVKKCIREDLHSQVDIIIQSATEKDLVKLNDILSGKSKLSSTTISKVCIELDFLTTKLNYFKKLPQQITDFGIDPTLIPDLIAEWRDEKLRNLGF